MQEKIKCPYCGEETSTALTHCEKCNQPLSKNASGSLIFKVLTALLLILGVILTAISWKPIGVTSLAFLLAFVMSAAVMYGIGRIIDLLFQIKVNIKR